MVEKLLDFIEKSPSPYQAVDNTAEALSEAGFERLYEHEKWNIKHGGRYYVIRDGSSIIAFIVPNLIISGFLYALRIPIHLHSR